MIPSIKHPSLAAGIALVMCFLAAPAAEAYTYQHYYMCFGYCPDGHHYYMCYGSCPYNPYQHHYMCYGYCPSNYGSYSYPYYPSTSSYEPYGGYLSGAADVTNAQGNFMVKQQQADLIKQQAEQEKIENRRRTFNEWLYERKNTPTPEEIREQTQAQELNRVQNAPPASEVYSGYALNVLLQDLQKLQDVNLRGPPVDLNPATLQQINVRPPETAGNIGVLRNEGQLDWPFALLGPAFKDERERVKALTEKAVKQAAQGTVDSQTINALGDALEKVRRKLADQITMLPTMEYIHAITFLKNFKSALDVLMGPDATKFFNGTYSARGKTLADLVSYMGQQGLQFAPAMPSQEAAYMALYQAMAHYDIASHNLQANQFVTKSAPQRN